MLSFFKFFKLVKSFVKKENVSFEDLVNNTNDYIKIISSFKGEDDFYKTNESVFHILKQFKNLSKEKNISFDSLFYKFKMFVRETEDKEFFSEEKTKEVIKYFIAEMDACRNNAMLDDDEFYDPSDVMNNIAACEYRFINNYIDKIDLDVKITFTNVVNNKKFYVENGSLAHLAANFSLFSLLDALLEKGININAKDSLDRKAGALGFTYDAWGKDKVKIFNSKLAGTHPNSEHWKILYEQRIMKKTLEVPIKNKNFKI